jgi:hypothetical protein
MNTDDLSTALKDMADRWDTPTYDPQLLVGRADRRTRRHRRQLTAAVGLICLTAVATGAAVLNQRTSHRSRQALPVSTQTTIPASLGLAPARPPGAYITALGATGPTQSGQRVLARTSGVKPVTLRAKLSFRLHDPARVDGAAIIITTPGTSPGVGGPKPDSLYRGRIVAEGSPISASAPRSRILTVTSPSGLAPGRYPVMSVMHTELLPGQTPGIQGPFNISGQIGILVITSHRP